MPLKVGDTVTVPGNAVDSGPFGVVEVTPDYRAVQLSNSLWYTLDEVRLVLDDDTPSAPRLCQDGVPRDSAERKACPVLRGVLQYFPDAIAAVANVSHVGNEQHNPGQPMHWAREKSSDHGDCIARHLTECGTLDDDGLRHSAKIAWRALALLQLEIEADKETK